MKTKTNLVSEPTPKMGKTNIRSLVLKKTKQK